MATMLKLQVSGLGARFTLDISSSATLGDLKTAVEHKTYLPVSYQQLVARGKKLAGDDATLASLGIQDRTSFMLMHSKAYAADKKGVDSITALLRQIDEVAETVESSPPKVIHEIITQICCKLDGVDTNGSETLRQMRKRAIEKAEAVDPTS